ncbi:MAG: S9 family peptidase [Lysobacter sp.]|nr:S9 family peptidase [Lysobacter sp.]
MLCPKSTARATVAALLFACAMPAQVHAQAPTAPAPAWQSFLKRSTIERVQISPDGARLAVAERADDRTFITVRDLKSMTVETRFNPGDGGEIHTLRWLDDQRLLVAANAVVKKYNVAFNDPVMAIVQRDGSDRYMLPANFLATIDGDPEHLLVTKCTNWGEGGCFDAVHKVEIGHLARLGDAMITAPDRDSVLFSDRRGNVRFAASTDDKANTKVHAHVDGAKGWTLVNDSEKSGLNVWPIGIDADGASAFLLAERAEGPSVVERYTFATGARTEVYRNASADPVEYVTAFDGETPIGAYYEATAPKAVIWNSAHPDAKAMAQILAAFPGKIVRVTSTSRDGNKAIVAVHGDRDPGTWYLFDRATNKATLVARAKSWLTDDRLPRQTAITLKARDGVELHGLLALPPTGAERGLPLVVIPHGGPYGVTDTASYDPETAILASAGYAVLRVNFRGSGGYGRKFEQSGYMQWGRTMQDDVTDATKWAIEQGYADKDRVCIYGWSYGGYAALMGAVREPSLYRCAVGGAGPYDLSKMYKWGSIRRSDLGLEYLAKVIGKDEKVLAERSPAKQAASIKVPVFLVHGRLDGRVDVAHARRMAKALKEAGVDVEFQEYLKGGHGLNLDEDESDFYAKLLVFLGKHTQAR